MRTEYEQSLDELKELSKDAHRAISGDFEWTAAAFTELKTAVRNLCHAVDYHVARVEDGTLSTARWPK